MAIYKHNYQEQHRLVVRIGLEQLTSRFHVLGPNHSAMHAASSNFSVPQR